MSLRRLSAIMGEIGHPLSHATLSEIERGDRRVTVDDLTAFAVALEVSPVTFLMPVSRTDDVDADEPVRLTGTPEAPARQLADWVRGDAPLRDTEDPFEVERFRRDSLPHWLWR